MIDHKDGRLPMSEAVTAYDLLDEVCQVITNEPLGVRHIRRFMADNESQLRAHLLPRKFLQTALMRMFADLDGIAETTRDPIEAEDDSDDD